MRNGFHIGSESGRPERVESPRGCTRPALIPQALVDELAALIVAALQMIGHWCIADEWASAGAAAIAMCCTERHLRELRKDGTGPEHRRIGKTVVYYIPSVADWLLRREAAKAHFRKSEVDDIEFRSPRRYVSTRR